VDARHVGIPTLYNQELSPIVQWMEFGPSPVTVLLNRNHFQYCVLPYIFFNIKRLLHDIFHIGPGISPRLPYQARQQSWRADISSNNKTLHCTMGDNS
jgi:hypothetical protein